MKIGRAIKSNKNNCHSEHTNIEVTETLPKKKEDNATKVIQQLRKKNRHNEENEKQGTKRNITKNMVTYETRPKRTRKTRREE